MVRDMLSAGPRPYRCARFLDLNTLGVVLPNRELSSLPSPQLLLFLKGRQLLAKDVVNSLQCDLGDVNCVNHPQHVTFRAGWPKDGETGGPGGRVWRKPRLGCMRVQIASAKVKVTVKVEGTVPIQDRTENPAIIVGCVN